MGVMRLCTVLNTETSTIVWNSDSVTAVLIHGSFLYQIIHK